MSLLELIAALAVVAIVSCLSVPGFFSLQQALRMEQAVNGLVSSFQLARQESIASHTTVSVCPRGANSECAPGNNWQQGWMVFRNRDNDEPPQRDPGETILRVQGALPGVAITSNRASYALRPGGVRSTNGTLTLCNPRGSPARVVISYTGKPRRERDGNCAD